MLKIKQNISFSPRSFILGMLRQASQNNSVDLVSEKLTFEDLIAKHLEYALYELRLSPKTVQKYKESLGWVLKYLPHLKYPQDLGVEDMTRLKKIMYERHLSESRINSLIFALRAFWNYCIDVRKMNLPDPKFIKPVTVPQKPINFMTKEEINQLLDSIDIHKLAGLRMRALMEVLIASGMRISEALSLDKDSIDWVNTEASIIGKGNKPRDVFFNERGVEHLKKYLANRKDNNPALFVTIGDTKRWKAHDMSKAFKHYTKKAGLAHRKITPHVFRHSSATLMLENNCDITFISKFLGHSDIRTTVKYYAGVDKRSLKSAYNQFLKF